MKFPPSFECIRKVLRKYRSYSISYDDDIRAYIPVAKHFNLSCFEAAMNVKKELKTWRKKNVDFNEDDYFSKVPTATEIPIFEEKDLLLVKDKLEKQWLNKSDRLYLTKYKLLYKAKFIDYYGLDVFHLRTAKRGKIYKKTKDTWFETMQEVIPKYAKLYPNTKPIRLIQAPQLSSIRSVGNR